MGSGFLISCVSLQNSLLVLIRKIFVEYNQYADTRSLYVHWPFCPYKCHFCPFVAIANHDDFMHEYHESLIKEIKMFSQKQFNKQPLETLYLGGGTPSTYPDKLLLDMFGTLRDSFDFSQISEITIEANPGTVRQEQLDVWKEVGITRLSIGVQSLNDTILKNLNRHQRAEDVYRLIGWAAEKFEVLSIDLIIGLPGVSEEEWKKMLQEIVTWPIKHLSMYFLSIHENTPLYFRIKKNDIVLAPDEATVDLYYWSVDLLEKHGFAQYEVSSFAQSGSESLHNQVYWDRRPYKGFGIGACSFDGSVRFQNEKNLKKYIDSLENGKTVTAFSETLTPEDEHLEKVMLGLRRKKGLALQDVLTKLSSEKRELFLEKIGELEKGNFVRRDGDKLYLTPTALAVENEIAVTLSF